MERPITLSGLQEFIKNKDHHPELKHAYLMKLIEEVGELAKIIRKGDFKHEQTRYAQTGQIKNTLEEELYDVVYYVLALANVYGVDIEQCVRMKEEYNAERSDHD